MSRETWNPKKRFPLFVRCSKGFFQTGPDKDIKTLKKRNWGKEKKRYYEILKGNRRWQWTLREPKINDSERGIDRERNRKEKRKYYNLEENRERDININRKRRRVRRSFWPNTVVLHRRKRQTTISLSVRVDSTFGQKLLRV
jgi:hypothetical protein